MQGRAMEVAAVNVQFVARLAPANCYGLYSGDVPAYCSGNQTVFDQADAWCVSPDPALRRLGANILGQLGRSDGKPFAGRH